MTEKSRDEIIAEAKVNVERVANLNATEEEKEKAENKILEFVEDRFAVHDYGAVVEVNDHRDTITSQ